MSTQAVYALDLATAPTLRLQHVLREISQSRFFPEGPRAQYFAAEVNLVQATEAPAVPVGPVLSVEECSPERGPEREAASSSIKQEASSSLKLEAGSASEVIEVLSDSLSSSSDSASSESDDSVEVHQEAPVKVARPTVSWSLADIRTHVQSKRAHKLSFATEGGLELLECGFYQLQKANCLGRCQGSVSELPTKKPRELAAECSKLRIEEVHGESPSEVIRKTEVVRGAEPLLPHGQTGVFSQGLDQFKQTFGCALEKT